MKKSVFTLALAFVLTSGIASASESHSSLSKSTEFPIENLADINLNSFCKAIITGNYDMVAELIEMGEDINKKSLGKTPAMYAARYNKAKILSLLIEKGADLSVKSDQEKQTAEELAVNSNAKEAIEILKKSGKK
ncbi:ankyrin repeat domain-containing protein [Zunongwangia pacifica]|uniref:Ankyrin repeat domain-containing protein n=1 Tax=Zunongwangia pacifica TaxID=2911062 RepID=A0A9X1ZV64_9FLAO|nr:ankyrin repeat domain-containing protein [Zunongwangia pacifica]MCL6216956.1 ankyrin repeat domain-containing protein [Zunongwangia pacifica]